MMTRAVPKRLLLRERTRGFGITHMNGSFSGEVSRFTVVAYIPPTPFLLKDWERYDISRYVPAGSVSPEEGIRTVAVEENVIKWSTIQNELGALVGNDALDRAILLFHAPPSDTPLDRAALDGQMYEQVPIDVHVGSIAVRRFIEQRQPLLTLHGHVHEAARMTGEWKIDGPHDLHQRRA